QFLIAGDGVGDADERRRVEPKGAHRFLAQEAIVVDFGETVIDEEIAHFVLETARRIAGRYGGGHQRRLRRDGTVAYHAAHFFHQIVLAGDGVGDADERRRVEPKGAHRFLAQEAIVVDFGETVIDEEIAHFVLETARRIAGRYGGGHQRRLRRDGTVAYHAAHFFHQIVLDGHVFGGAPTGHGHREHPGLGFADAERQALQNTPHLSRFDGAPQLALQPRQREFDRARRGHLAHPIGQTAHQPDAGRNLSQQFDGAGQAAYRVHRILRLFETHAGVGAQLDRRRSPANRRRLEIGAFQHHARGLGADRAIAAADHAGQRDGARRIRDHQVRFIQRVSFVIERAEGLAGLRRANEDGVPVQQVGVEGVHGLRQFGHHEVRHIDDVVDRVEADRRQPVLQPQRRGLHRDVFENQRAVPRTQFEIFYLDFDRRRTL